MERTSKVEEVMDKYVSRYYDLAQEVPFNFLQKCNKTGVSYGTNRVLAELAERINDFGEINDMFPENLYLKLLEYNEFLPEDKAVNHYNAIKLWLEGSSYITIREIIFKNEDDLQ